MAGGQCSVALLYFIDIELNAYIFRMNGLTSHQKSTSLQNEDVRIAFINNDE